MNHKPGFILAIRHLIVRAALSENGDTVEYLGKALERAQESLVTTDAGVAVDIALHNGACEMLKRAGCSILVDTFGIRKRCMILADSWRDHPSVVPSRGFDEAAHYRSEG